VSDFSVPQSKCKSQIAFVKVEFFPFCPFFFTVTFSFVFVFAFKQLVSSVQLESKLK
jgi:hypothetical protein